jgi:hypothetical protein
MPNAANRPISIQLPNVRLGIASAPGNQTIGNSDR